MIIDRPQHIREPERCIKTCNNARYINGTWVCPMFINVDRVAIETKGGIRCRRFERKMD